MPTPAQIRAARAMLDITQAELSRLSGVSLPRVAAFEAGQREAPFSAVMAVARSSRQASDLSWNPAKIPTQKTTRLAKAIVNADRRAKNLPELE